MFNFYAINPQLQIRWRYIGLVKVCTNRLTSYHFKLLKEKCKMIINDEADEIVKDDDYYNCRIWSSLVNIDSDNVTLKVFDWFYEPKNIVRYGEYYIYKPNLNRNIRKACHTIIKAIDNILSKQKLNIRDFNPVFRYVDANTSVFNPYLIIDFPEKPVYAKIDKLYHCTLTKSKQTYIQSMFDDLLG